MEIKRGIWLLESLLPLISKGWSLTLQDIAPFIGIAVVVIIVVAIILFIVWWYRFWVERGLKKYAKQRSGVRLKTAD